MSWDLYKDQYLNLILTFKQAELVISIVDAVLKDFPHNLPKSLHKDLIDLLNVNLYGLTVCLADMKDRDVELGEYKPQTKVPQKIHPLIDRPVGEDEKEIDLNPIFLPFITIMGIRAKQRKPETRIDYQNIFYNQQIVMFISQIEAFIGDSIRAMCRAKPQIISSLQKQISWEAALAHPNRDSLFEYLIEEFVSLTLKSKDITGVVSTLINNHAIKLDIEPKFIKIVSLLEQVRHIIVHSGGLVDEKFIKKTGKLSASSGEPIQIDEKFLKDSGSSCIRLAQSIFEAVSKKYYDLPDPLSRIGFKFGGTFIT